MTKIFSKVRSRIPSKNRLTVTLASLALLGSVGYAATVGIVKADFDSNNRLVQALSVKLGLNEDVVAEALDEVRADHFAQMQTSHEEKLNQAVIDGVITQEQKQTLLEHQQDMFDLKKSEIQARREEMDAWFEDQGIDHDALMEYMGPMGMGHHHGMFGDWNKTDSN